MLGNFVVRRATSCKKCIDVRSVCLSTESKSHEHLSNERNHEEKLDPSVLKQYKHILKSALSSINSRETTTTSPTNTTTNVHETTQAKSEPKKIESLATLLAKKVAASVIAQPDSSGVSSESSKNPTPSLTSLTGLLTEKELEEVHQSLPSRESSKSWYTISKNLLESMSTSFVHPSSTLIGDIHFGRHCSLFPNVVLRGDVNSIRIGSCTNIQDNSVIHVSSAFPCKLGDNVTVGHQACLHACTIESNVLVGMGTTIMDGALIRQFSIIGAGSLITSNQEFPEMSLIVGRPAKLVRSLTEEEKRLIIKSAEKYVLLKDLHMKASPSSSKRLL